MTGVFGFRLQYREGVDYVPFLPPSLAGAVSVEPVVFTAEPPFYVDDSFPAYPVVRRTDAPEDVWWPLDKAIELGIARTSKEWTAREVSR